MLLILLVLIQLTAYGMENDDERALGPYEGSSTSALSLQPDLPLPPFAPDHTDLEVGLGSPRSCTWLTQQIAHSQERCSGCLGTLRQTSIECNEHYMPSRRTCIDITKICGMMLGGSFTLLALLMLAIYGGGEYMRHHSQYLH